jgi:hypothetical protein
MRASIFLQNKGIHIRSNGGNDLRFIAMDVDDCTIFFDGYGEENAAFVRDLAEGLLKAAMEMSSLIALDKDKAEHDAEMERLTSREDDLQHDTREEHKEEV